MTPSVLRNLGHFIFMWKGTTAVKTLRGTTATDTGTWTSTSATFDQVHGFGAGATSTAKKIKGGILLRQFRSLVTGCGVKLTFKSTTGKYVVFTGEVKTCSSTSGAGSTWETLSTAKKTITNGTSTAFSVWDQFQVSADLQRSKRFLKTNIKIAFKTATGGQDTTTNTAAVIMPQTWVFGGPDKTPAAGY